MFKINISEKSGKTYKMESETEELLGKELHNIIHGKDLNSDLEGYEFEIVGTSDSSGFPGHEAVAGEGLKKLLLTYGKAMHGRPRKEGKKPRSAPTPKGLRLRKTVRGKIISADIIQINLKVTKHGSRPLSEIFPGQAQGKAKKENREMKRAKKRQEAQRPAEEKTVEQIAQ